MPSKKSMSFKKEQKEGTELLGSQASITLATSGEKTSGEKSKKSKKPKVLKDDDDETNNDKDMPASRNVVMTLHDWTEDEYQRLLVGHHKYIIIGKEVCPTTKRLHLQMYVEFSEKKTYSAIKKHFKINRLHIEHRMGTAKQASDYCKKDNDYIEVGEISQQGKRTDWVRAVEQLRTTAPIVEVVEEQPHLLPCIRALERFKQLSTAPIEREVEVIVLYGDAGSGKTRFAYDTDPNLYSKPSGDWWDGYAGEETILLDDFYGDIKYSELLKVLDRYKYRVQVKGGFVGARWKKVIITSNKRPCDWYHHGMTPALDRRISKVYHMSLNPDGSTTQIEESLTQELSINHIPRRREGTFYQEVNISTDDTI